MIITGGCGYIGAVLARLIPGNNVTLLDRLDYGLQGYREWKNARLLQRDFTGFKVGEETLVHLASPRLGQTGFTDYVEASKNLFETCKSKILFVSSCSVYGVNHQVCDEDTIPEPQDEYAKAKLELEKTALDKDGIVLRFATAYGDSPIPRPDLMINQFVQSVKKKQRLKIFNPKTVRPFANVNDLAHAIQWGLKADSGIYNIGGENWTKWDVAQKIIALSGGTLQAEATEGEDSRDYAVSFAKAQAKGYHAYWTLERWLMDRFA